MHDEHRGQTPEVTHGLGGQAAEALDHGPDALVTARGGQGQVAAQRKPNQPEPPGIEQEPAGVAQDCPACRSGDTLSTTFFPYVDKAANRTVPDPGVVTTLSLYDETGTLLDSQLSSIAQFTLPPSLGKYSLALDLARNADWWPTTVRTHTVWTFESSERAPDTLPPGWTCGGKGGGGGGGRGATTTADKGGGGGGGGGSDGCSFEPLLFASYDTHAGPDDIVPAGHDATIDVTVQRQAFAPAAEIASAYRLPAGAGAGRTVAIVDAFDDPGAEHDLGIWRAQFGLPPCTTANGCFRKVNQFGADGPLPRPDEGWGLEISLDLQAVSATCPSCRILLVEAKDTSLFNLATGVMTAVALGADAVSNSYGSRGEFSGQQYFERFYKHTGVAITASSGDYGYGNGLILTGGVSYPGASEFVTSVGGTTLLPDGSERGWTETAWAGSTSGCSAYIHKPGWQKDRLCDKRSVADVAAVADPKTGLAVYDEFGYGGWLIVGGTSLSSPIIASIYAMAGNTSSVRYGVDLYRGNGAFFDVVGGSNGSCGGLYLCTGVPGYDGPTGLGTPNGLSGF